MKGFIKIKDYQGNDRFLAIDQIASWGPEDQYRPHGRARVTLKTGGVFTTWYDCTSDVIAAAIAEAS